MKQNPFARRAPQRRRVGAGFGRAGSEGPGEAAARAESTAPSATSPGEAVAVLENGRPPQAGGNVAESDLDQLTEFLESEIRNHFTPEEVRMSERADLAVHVEEFVRKSATERGVEIDEAEVCDLATFLLNDLIETVGTDDDPLIPEPTSPSVTSVLDAKERVQPLLMEHIDPQAASELPRTELGDQVGEVVGELLVQEKIHLNLKEQRDLVTLLLNDMLGLGPLEPLLADDSISDIMVNGPTQVYVERGGKLELTNVRFRDDRHLLNIAQRIVNAVGRRVDETSPICDARLMDGSRVNVIIPPLAIDGASISIRKFSKKKITLDKMVEFGSLSPRVAQLLKVAGACRLNILISGGTGSGKTTMLNAISRLIDRGERIVTIEDAAELQLQQPHVVRLETRPPNLEGKGEITMRDLVKNALRMRPDRIILGEVRGGEAIDMLQAMNTGHDGSITTLHANSPRDCLSRLEMMILMAGVELPVQAMRQQISSAVNVIIQQARLRDGTRKVTKVTEITGMEGDTISSQDIFEFVVTGIDPQGKVEGHFRATGIRPKCAAILEASGFDLGPNFFAEREL